ncbi:MAG: anti-sigma factor family protein [Acidimicrobiia bacterium]
MISCSDAVRQLWEYLDGALAQGDRSRVDEHLGACLRCCGEAEFARELRRFLSTAGSASLPDDVRRRLLASLDTLEDSR